MEGAVLSTISRVVPMDVTADTPVSSYAGAVAIRSRVIMAIGHHWMGHVTMINASVGTRGDYGSSR